MSTKPHVIIIGAGFTGCATAYDLALRGCKVTVLERGEIASGTSGRTHGLLHSGGRYCVTDQEAAVECIEENIILRKIAAQCIEFNQGLFIALNEKDLAYRQSFIEGANACHIPIKEIQPQDALRLEPNLNPRLLAAFIVPDGTFDPLRLALAFAASARQNGAEFRPYHEIKSIVSDGKGRVDRLIVWNRHTGETYELGGELVVNATGAWAGQITAMIGVHVPVVPTPGVMVAFDERLVQHVINRLNEPGDGDIMIPQRRMVVMGTTSFETNDVDYVPVYEEQVKQMYENAIELVPAVRHAKERGAYMSSRPLIASTVTGRSLSRTFKCYDHKEEGVEGFVTITGGKATTCRVMAEKTADLVCQKLGINVPCGTREIPLVSYRRFYQL